MMYEFPIKEKQYSQVIAHTTGKKPFAVFTLDTDAYRDTSVGILIHGCEDGGVGTEDGSQVMTIKEFAELFINKHNLVERGIKEMMFLCCYGAMQEECYVDGIHVYPMLKHDKVIYTRCMKLFDGGCVIEVELG